MPSTIRPKSDFNGEKVTRNCSSLVRNYLMILKTCPLMEHKMDEELGRLQNDRSASHLSFINDIAVEQAII